MERIKFVLAVALSTALALSVVLGGEAIAEPLGAGLLGQFGVGSGNSGGAGTQAVTNVGLPVTVGNTSHNPVPVTVQGNTGQPLTAAISGTVNTSATINGTVDTQDVNDPSTQPFQTELKVDFLDAATSAGASNDFTVPSGKRLIIRYVSGNFETGTDQIAEITLRTTTAGTEVGHVIPEVTVGISSTQARHRYGLETWIAADSGTSVQVNATYYGSVVASTASADIAISGYLVDTP